jgi:uncharacterized RDD family membrane protein YckC
VDNPTSGLLAAGGRDGDVTEAGLVTPEAIVLGLPVASVGSRAVAILIDLLIQGGALVLLSFAAVSVAAADLGWVGFSIILLAVFGILFGYPTAFETFWRGRTPGKAAMGLRVVTVEAAPVEFRHAAIRAALGLIDFWATSGGVAVVSALFTKRAQRLGDLAAGTLVVREGRGNSVTALRFEPPRGAEAYTDQLDVSTLTERDYVMIRSVLVRTQGMHTQVAAPLAAQALTVVQGRFTPAPPGGMPALVVLQCLAAAYQRRHRNRAQPQVSDWIWR